MLLKYLLAWFTATDASATAAQSPTGSLTAVLGASDSNGFTVTVSAIGWTNNTDVLLTDDLGDTYVYNATLSTNTKITTSSGYKYATAVIKYTVSYSGTAADANAVNAQWDALVGSTDLVITLADTTVYNAANHFSDGMISADAASKGLKIFNVDHNFIYAQTSNEHPYGKPNPAENTLTVTASYLKDTLTFTGSNGVYSSGELTAGTKYIGIMGVNSVVQDQDDTYEVTVTPSASWLTAYSDPGQP